MVFDLLLGLNLNDLTEVGETSHVAILLCDKSFK